MIAMVANDILTYLDRMIYLNPRASNGISGNVCIRPGGACESGLLLSELRRAKNRARVAAVEKSPDDGFDGFENVSPHRDKGSA